MCGLAGAISPRVRRSDVERMVGALRHRGPDSDGVWVDPAGRIALGHARLAIVDLSPAGQQPMQSPSGRYIIAFNGEIYNHTELRAELARSRNLFDWRGHSDTETLLAGFEVWGIVATIQRCIGMFACAVWDSHRETLSLIRDRIGEKPLYYGRHGDTVLFGSELKALKAHSAFCPEVNRDSVALLMRHNYIPAPHSIYRGIKKLMPGCVVECSVSGDIAKPAAYWDARSMINHGLLHPFQGSPDEAVAQLEVLLSSAVVGQLMGDVPVGAFLSGGVDSSAIVSLMQAHSARPVKTFTIGFHEAVFNEAQHAKAVARHLGTDHTELYVSPRECLDVIPKLPQLYCEPFSDSSQVPTFLVSQLARGHVSVSLSGDAGDELFAGYTRYLLTARLWGKLSQLPVSIRRSAAAMLRLFSPQQWNRLLVPVMRTLPERWSFANPGDKLLKAASVLASKSAIELYRELVSHWSAPLELVLGAAEPLTLLTDPERRPATDSLVHDMMAMDLLSYLPDDVLVKVDRASMGVSLETRVPMLDHRVVEFAWQLPLSIAMRDGVPKWPLRQLLYRSVPKELIERPKMGFGVPIDSWLRGPLRGWAEELLSESRLNSEGFLNASLVRSKWSEHLSGRRNWQYLLWDVLMFQAWLNDQ
jgi:asparagine synthase (glutamine-hydrolysing)